MKKEYKNIVIFTALSLVALVLFFLLKHLNKPMFYAVKAFDGNNQFTGKYYIYWPTGFNYTSSNFTSLFGGTFAAHEIAPGLQEFQFSGSYNSSIINQAKKHYRIKIFNDTADLASYLINN